MSGLVPEKRVDSKGNWITRWVRPRDPLAGFPIHIPAPVAPDPLPVPPLSEPQATPATMFALDSFLREKKWRAYSFATPLLDNFSRMPDSLASELVADLRERNTFHGVFELGMTVKRIFGIDSPVSNAIKENVFRNLMDSIPAEGMILEEDSAGVIALGTTVFIGINGMNQGRRFPVSESRVYASVAAVAHHIFGNDPDRFDAAVLRDNGFDLDDGQLRLRLRSTESIGLLLRHAGRIDELRDELIARNSLNPDVVRTVISADGALRSGVL